MLDKNFYKVCWQEDAAGYGAGTTIGLAGAGAGISKIIKHKKIIHNNIMELNNIMQLEEISGNLSSIKLYNRVILITNQYLELNSELRELRSVILLIEDQDFLDLQLINLKNVIKKTNLAHRRKKCLCKRLV